MIIGTLGHLNEDALGGPAWVEFAELHWDTKASWCCITIPAYGHIWPGKFVAKFRAEERIDPPLIDSSGIWTATRKQCDKPARIGYLYSNTEENIGEIIDYRGKFLPVIPLLQIAKTGQYVLPVY